MPPPIRTARLLAALVALASAAPAAQPLPDPVPAARPVTPLGLGAGPAAVAVGGYDEAWVPGPGAAGRLGLDLPRVAVRAALSAVPFEARADVPPFLNVSATLGAGPRWGRVGGPSLAAGPVVGVVAFRFRDAVGRPGYQGNELETAVGAFARAQAPVGRRLAVWADAEALRLALSTPRTVVAVGGGVAVRLDVPAGWLW